MTVENVGGFTPEDQPMTETAVDKALQVAADIHDRGLALCRGAAMAEDCFNAALCEGLNEVLAETTDERLKDLVERRLLFAHEYLTDGLNAYAGRA
jgi:uncharacterized protein YutE (UPF0331/DUF86 family)